MELPTHVDKVFISCCISTDYGMQQSYNGYSVYMYLIASKISY